MCELESEIKDSFDLLLDLLNGMFDLRHVHPVVPEEADQFNSVLGLVLNPQKSVVHVVLTASDLTPCNACLMNRYFK